MALVITLVLLVVITTLAVAFLALSYRETAAVSSALATTDAGHAADAALERAQGHILAQLIARNKIAFGSDVMGPDLIVSVARDVPTNVPSFLMNVATNRWANPTNIDRLFADPAVPVLIWTNKSYNTPAAVEARDYVDLNRNGTLEATGFLTDVNDSGMVLRDANGAPVVQWRVGDPQWIGILRDPTRPHGKDNHFIARYAFILLPTGRSLDVNWIHNQAIARRPANDWSVDGYFRNQGVGTYELNLAAFLADVNTNYWNNPTGTPYLYSPTDSQAPAAGSRGDAFADAREFLSYRYASNKANTAVADALFRDVVLRPTIPNVFTFDLVDAFANGPLVPFGRSAETALASDDDNPAFSWPGSDSRRHFFTIHDFLDVKKLPVTTWSGAGFLARLGNASSRINTEDRSTYYRILSQLGTDSPAESDGRMNLNYRNVTNNYTATPITLVTTLGDTNFSRSGLATNFVPWTAAEFFHAAADRMLTNEFFPYGLTNIGLLEGRSIPIYARTNPGAGNLSVFGFPIASIGTATAFTNSTYPLYSPRIHQLLQLALNIYEATQTNDNAFNNSNLPTVLRPVFDRTAGGEIMITRYQDETGNANLRTDVLNSLLVWHELGDPAAPLGPPGSPNLNLNFFDVPILFGARKGIPNFNEFTSHTYLGISRIIELRRDQPNAANDTNYSFFRTIILTMTNFNYCELLNPYSNAVGSAVYYPRPLEVVTANVVTGSLTNDVGYSWSTPNIPAFRNFTNGAGLWSNSFRLTQLSTNLLLPPAYLRLNPAPFLEPFTAANSFTNSPELIIRPNTNRWGLVVSNRFRFFLFDGGRMVDCFASSRMVSRYNVNDALNTGLSSGGTPALEGMWSTRLSSNPLLTEGELKQIDASRGGVGGTPDSAGGWVDYGGIRTVASSVTLAQQGFDAFMKATTNDIDSPPQQAPFSPMKRIPFASSWEVNDPAVHYTVYDLYDGSVQRTNSTFFTPNASPPYNLLNKATWGQPKDSTAVTGTPFARNERYQPWGGRDANSGNNADYNYAEKDPGVFWPDLWDFPTQKFPNLGWLGRVHRGTPWQTVYLKADIPSYSASVLERLRENNDWWLHVGAAFMPQTFPTNDWRLLDLFTAAIHPNATRGRLSINQTNLAAWSAVFGGVIASIPIDDGSGSYKPQEIVLQPASTDVTNSWVPKLVEGINRTRGNRTFARLSDFMAVPELSVNSPLLLSDDAIRLSASTDDAIRRSVYYEATDADYEKIPQQILSLVKVGEPRYVVYAWGQSLKPADYTPGIGVSIDPGTQVPRNYQITGEMATRAVVRVEFGKDANGRTDYRRPHTVVENFNILPNE